MRPPRATRAVARRANDRSRGSVAGASSDAEARRIETAVAARDSAGPITLIYFDPRTLTAKTLVLPLRSKGVAALGCACLLMMSAMAGFAARAASTMTEPGRVLAMHQRLGGPVLRSIFASIPGLDGAHAVTTPEPARDSESVIRARAERLGLGTMAAASALIGGTAKPEWVRAAGEGSPPIHTLRWPVDGGWFVRGYGSGTEGYHLAVDVGAPTGQRVRAAAPGIVAYADDEVRGFGNLLLLVHPNGWITLYAHNSRHHVVVGERVSAGQLIAEVGSTGISRGPHVHFELLHGGKNCDPAPLFRPGMRHRDGAFSEITQADWDVAGSRPAAIRCGRRRIHPNSPRLHDHGAIDGRDHVDVELDADAPSASAGAPAATEG